MSDAITSAGITPAVVDPREAERAIARLARAKVVSLDTEGDGMFRYRTRLCTVQLAADGEVCVLDTLAFDATALLRPLLGDTGPEKVVHDVSFDARVLLAHGITLGNVFDTSIAARFLGLKSTGLSSLLAQWFGMELPKHKQHADWGARPLDEEALRYLEDDVRHLDALASVLLERVREQDIEAEVREECAYMLAEARTPAPWTSPWMRLKGAGLRPPRERARLYELAWERELLARELDVPPARLVPNDLVLRLGELEIQSIEELTSRLGSRMSVHAHRLWQAVTRAKSREDAPEDEVRALLPRPPSTAEIERKKRRRRVLTDFRAREATARGVDPQVVLPGHCLSDTVDLEVLSLETLARVPGLGLCRIERYGHKLVEELASSW